MDVNRAFSRSLNFLSKPFSWVALLLLLVNDSILKNFWPSPVTGKISDLAWLFLAPVVVTAGIAWAAPKWLRMHERLLAGIGFGTTAVIFALFKTVPFVREMVLEVWRAGLGFPAAAVLDPTDLAALLSLVGAAWLWLRQCPHAAAIPRRAVLVIPLLALLTLADAAAPDYGIACLDRQEGQIVARSSNHEYASQDGGLTWTEGGFGMDFCDISAAPAQELILEPAGLHFRFQPGQNIESSSDGSHWTVAYPLVPLTEADRAYYQKVQSGNPVMSEPPLGGIVDTQHGNVIFAMGFEGVLVRQSSGEWTWAAVGNYHRVEAASPFAFIETVLSGELILAAALVFLILSFGAFIRRRHLIWSLLIWTGWLGWVLLLLVLPPALSSLYLSSVSIMGTLVIAALAFLMSVFGSIRLLRVSPVSFWRLLGIALAGGVIFLLMFVLWAFNLLSQYYVTSSLALIGGVTAGIAGMALVRNHRQPGTKMTQMGNRPGNSHSL